MDKAISHIAGRHRHGTWVRLDMGGGFSCRQVVPWNQRNFMMVRWVFQHMLILLRGRLCHRCVLAISLQGGWGFMMSTQIVPISTGTCWEPRHFPPNMWVFVVLPMWQPRRDPVRFWHKRPRRQPIFHGGRGNEFTAWFYFGLLDQSFLDVVVVTIVVIIVVVLFCVSGFAIVLFCGSGCVNPKHGIVGFFRFFFWCGYGPCLIPEMDLLVLLQMFRVTFRVCGQTRDFSLGHRMFAILPKW